jgi:flavin reductase (DIM6/NTAB) family NADH-FMN oxidoreductase RutF
LMDDAEAEFHRLAESLDYPMFVVTAASAGERDGCLVGFATQCSIHPPRLFVLLSKLNRTERIAREASHLGVHFLGGNDRPLAERFGAETADAGADKFAGLDWEEGPGGLPLLAAGRGWVLGAILERLDAGDHVGHLVDVEAVRRFEGNDPGPALGFQRARDIHPGHPA